MCRMYFCGQKPIVVVFSVLLVAMLFADVPHLISYQGRLTDSGGAPLTGSHNITFTLYDAEVGGTALWTETHSGVSLNSEGLYNVMLGSTTPFPSTLTFEQQYWLAISVDGGAEICRYELGASPYALNIADTIRQSSGYVMTDGTRRGGLALNGLSLASGEIIFPTRDAVGLYGYGNGDVGLYARSNLWEGIIGYSEGDDGVQGVSTSSFYAGVHGMNTYSGTVDGYLAFNGYGLYTPDNAYIGDYLQFATLTSSPAVGEGRVYYNSTDRTLYLWDGATWQDLLGGGGVTGIRSNANPYLIGDVTLQEGTNITLSQAGNVITINAAGGSPSLWNDGGTYIEATNNSTVRVNDSGELFYFQVNGDMSTGASIYGNTVASGSGERYGVYGNCGSLPSGSGDNYGVKGTASGGTINYGVYGDVGGNVGYGVYGTGGAGKPFGYLGGQNYAVYGEGNVAGSVYDTNAVATFINTSTYADAAGVYAVCANTPNWGFGGYFRGGFIGIEGVADTVGSGSRYGISAHASGGSIANYAVYGYASGDSGVKYGIYSTVSGDGINWAGYFNGNVNIVGTLSKGSGSFLIDHPDDPLHKTLRHNFVESPENLCLYRGKVKLDERGKAIVKMPDYFKSLTKEDEASINLTPVGKPFLTGAEWNDDYTAFTVYGEPSREVYWTVYADRDDPVMHKLYRPVVEDKGEDKICPVGKLLYPEAYGYPEEMGRDYDIIHRQDKDK